jgi:hypothetical protein
MSAYSGMVRVTVTATGPCTVGFSTVQVFDVEHASAAVSFQMYANSCSGVTGNPLQTTLPIADASFTASPCVAGWEGALTAGIANFAYPAGILSYEVKVDEVDPLSGAFISNIFDQSAPGSVPNLNFNTPSSGWFFSNYAALSNSNRTFKVTVFATTVRCTGSAISYFRIAKGNMFWKDENGNAVGDMPGMTSDIKVYPNPANSEVNFEWMSAVKESATSEIVILDMLGRTVLSKTVEVIPAYNKQTIDVSALPTGMYMYKMSVGGDVKAGKFEKN